MALLRWWEGWPQLLLALALVLAMHEAWLAARNASARRAGEVRISPLRGAATAATQAKAAAVAAVWATALALLFSFDWKQLGVYLSTFFLVRRLVLDADERRRARAAAA